MNKSPWNAGKSVGQKILELIKPPYWRVDIVWFSFWSLIAFCATMPWVAIMGFIKMICPHAFGVIKISLTKFLNSPR